MTELQERICKIWAEALTTEKLIEVLAKAAQSNKGFSYAQYKALMGEAAVRLAINQAILAGLD